MQLSAIDIFMFIKYYFFVTVKQRKARGNLIKILSDKSNISISIFLATICVHLTEKFLNVLKLNNETLKQNINIGNSQFHPQ